MSGPLHHGHHPDADQLSAFAEHVLPDHERLETLAHLAQCADCRQIVFLAQNEQQVKDPLPRALPGRIGWWKNWHDLWPVASALACGLLIVVLLQRRHPTNLPQSSVTAIESSAPAPPSQAQAPQPVAPAPPLSGSALSPKSPATAKASSSLHPASAAPRVDVEGIGSVNGNLATNHLKNNLSGFSRSVPAADQQSANALSAGSQSMGGVISAPAAQAPLSQEQKNSLLTDKREQRAAPQSQDQLFSQQAATPRSEPSQSNMPPRTSQTVDVTSAPSALQTENAVISASVFNPGRVAQAKSARAPLPSGRFTVSTISNGLETLAVDSAGDLFLSKDAAKSWQRVAHQWTGKAARVSLASSSSMTQPVSKRALSAGATVSTNLETVTPAAVPPGVGFELTSDTGATWSSPDGLVWKLK